METESSPPLAYTTNTQYDPRQVDDNGDPDTLAAEIPLIGSQATLANIEAHLIATQASLAGIEAHLRRLDDRCDDLEMCLNGLRTMISMTARLLADSIERP